MHLAVLSQCRVYLINQHQRLQVNAAPAGTATCLTRPIYHIVVSACVIETSNKKGKGVLCRDVGNDNRLMVWSIRWSKSLHAKTMAKILQHTNLIIEWMIVLLVAGICDALKHHHDFMNTMDQKWTDDFLLTILDNMLNAPDTAFGKTLG